MTASEFEFLHLLSTIPWPSATTVGMFKSWVLAVVDFLPFSLKWLYPKSPSWSARTPAPFTFMFPSHSHFRVYIPPQQAQSVPLFLYSRSACAAPALMELPLHSMLCFAPTVRIPVVTCVGRAHSLSILPRTCASQCPPVSSLHTFARADCAPFIMKSSHISFPYVRVSALLFQPHRGWRETITGHYCYLYLQHSSYAPSGVHAVASTREAWKQYSYLCYYIKGWAIDRKLLCTKCFCVLILGLRLLKWAYVSKKKKQGAIWKLRLIFLLSVCIW